MDDSTLAAAAARGDETAFADLVKRYRPYVYAIAYKILLHEDDALDAAQTVFLRLVERLGAFDGRGPFRRWIATIAVREALTLRDRRTPRETPTDPVDLARLQDDGPHSATMGSNPATPREQADRNERRARVEAAMGQLSAQQRAIFALRFREDLGSGEIAERLGLAPGHVRVQLCRALARLRKILGEDS